MSQNQNLDGFDPYPLILGDTLREWQSIIDGAARLTNLPVGIFRFTSYPTGQAILASTRPKDIGQSSKSGSMSLAQVASELGSPVNTLTSNHNVNVLRVDGDFPVDIDSPLVWPDGKPFGRLCIFGAVGQSNPVIQRLLLVHARELVQQDLKLLYWRASRKKSPTISDYQDLRGKKRAFRLLAEHTKEHFFLHDDAGRFMDVDQEAVRSTGYSREELLKMRITDLVLDESDWEKNATWARMFPGESSVRTLYQQHKDKTVFPVDVHITCYLFDRQKVFLRLVRDISLLYREKNSEFKFLSEIPERRGTGSANLLRAVMEGATDVIFLKDLSGRFQLLNQAAANFVGRSEVEVIGRTATDLFGELVGEQIRKAELRVLLYGEPSTTEETILQNGRVYHFQVTRSLHRDSAGKSIGIIGIAHDITVKRLAEEKVRSIERRWQFALDSGGDGIWDWDMESGHVFYSQQWKNILGYEEDEIGHSIDDWSTRVHSRDLVHCWEIFRSLLKGERPTFEFEHRMKAKDGSWRWLLSKGKIVERAEDGRPLRMIATNRDITTRKLEELELRTQSERLAVATEVCGLGVWDYYVEKDELYCDPQWYRILGLDASVSIESIEDFKAYIHPEDVQLATDVRVKTREAVLSHGGDYHNSFRIIRPDGEIRWIQSSGYLAKIADGNYSRAVGVIRDITKLEMIEPPPGR